MLPLLRLVALLVALAGSSRIASHESTRPQVFLAQATTPVTVESARKLTPLTIELTFENQTEPVAGLVRITRVDDNRVVDLPAHLRRPMGWFSLTRDATVEVPATELKIEACHGLHTEIATTTLDVAANPPRPLRVRLTLRPFYDPAGRGFVGANTHLHLQLNAPRGMGGAWLRSRRDAEDYLRAIGRSDALDLVYVSHLERTNDTPNYVSNEFTRDDLARFSDARVRFVNGQEHRHEGGRATRRGGPDELRYGHVLFLDLPRLVQPVSYGAIFMPGLPASDVVPMRRAIEQARDLGATVVWCHGRQGTEDLPNWIAGRLHAQNIFDGGGDGTYETIFYPYLDAGFRVPFSTGTDWGCYDFSRVYVASKEAAASRGFLEQLSAGRSFITNGTFLEFDVDGKHPGDTIDLATAPHLVTVRGRAVGRDDFGHLDIIHNGETHGRVASRRVGDHYEANSEFLIEIRDPSWLALRISTTRPYNDRSEYSGAGANLFGKALFAHTSPVYVNVGGKGRRQPDAIRTLIADAEAAIRTIEAKGAFATDAERAALLALYRDAIAALQARLP